MAELVREIEKEDIPKINTALKNVRGGGLFRTLIVSAA